MTRSLQKIARLDSMLEHGAPSRFLVLGGASCVWNDVQLLERELGHPWNGWVVAANDIGVHWPDALDHWVTLHPNKFPRWRDERRRYNNPDGYLTWSTGHKSSRGIDRACIEAAAGSSGMYAVQVVRYWWRQELAPEMVRRALFVPQLRIVLAGIPMTNTGFFSQSTEYHMRGANGEWSHADKHWKAWVKAAPEYKFVVRSMSGRTRELLEAPTREWLLD